MHIISIRESISETGHLIYPLPLFKESGLLDNRDTIYRRTSGTLQSVARLEVKLEAVLTIMNNDLKAGQVEQFKRSPTGRV